MITLCTSTLSENLGFNCEDIQVKSVSAAWNKIREIRDTTEPSVLNDTLLSIKSENSNDFKRIPEKIYFTLNKKGKIEFKDYSKMKK